MSTTYEEQALVKSIDDALHLNACYVAGTRKTCSRCFALPEPMLLLRLLAQDAQRVLEQKNA